MRKFTWLAAVLFVVSLSNLAAATPITGSAWQVSGGASSLATLSTLITTPGVINPAGLPAGPADVTFDANALHFNLGSSATNTLAAFLASGSAYNIVDTGGILNDPISVPSGTTNATATFFKFLGSAYFVNGQTYHVTHDDGFYLMIGDGTNVDFRTPVATTTDHFTFGGATGAYDFTLYYGEWNGLPANLDTDFQPVPEPASLLLLGTGLVGIGRAWRKRRA